LTINREKRAILIITISLLLINFYCWFFFITGAGIKNRNAKTDVAGSWWEYQEAPRDAPEQGDGWDIACNFLN